MTSMTQNISMNTDIKGNLRTTPELIVMLTYNDYTVENAEEIFEQCRHSSAGYWGMKEEPLPISQMKSLFTRMKECGKTTVLEVVAYDEEGALRGAKTAVECGCDILMGTKFHQTVSDLCHRNGIRYMPFIGKTEGRPSVLTGTIEEMTEEAKDVMSKGADGVDLLGYRYAGNAIDLIKAITDTTGGKACIAGSIDGIKRLYEISEASPMLFTIGSAFFDKKFGDDISQQIDTVCRHMRKDRNTCTKA